MNKESCLEPPSELSRVAVEDLNSNPVRDAIVRFFESLLGAPDEVHEINGCGNATQTWLSFVKARARSFQELCLQHGDRAGTYSDVIYAQLVFMFQVISVSQLLKLCEGFRRISIENAYESLNNAHVQADEGIRALAYGCRHGIMPAALSYRHSPHPFTTTAQKRVIATIDMTTVDRFKRVVRNIYRDEVVIWIDLAVKGLSVDGEWFVRGLLPYSLVPLVAAHRGTPDLSRPWIYLEWRLSTRAFSVQGNLPKSDPADALVIALQAMYAPDDMMRNYEYAGEMEDVILDMFIFGLCAFGGKQTDSQLRRQVLVWDDLKVTSTVALALSSFEVERDKDARFGKIAFDTRDPYGCGLFRCGVGTMLGTVGIRISADGAFEAFKVIDGHFIITKREENCHLLLTRVPDDALLRLRRRYGHISVKDVLRREVERAANRYDLRTTQRNVTFDSVDELALLSCCDVRAVERVSQWRSCDDADATLADSIAQLCGVRDTASRAECRFDLQKARQNVERRGRHSLAAWSNRVRQGGETETITAGVTGKAVVEEGMNGTLGTLWMATQFGTVRIISSCANQVVARRFAMTSKRQLDAPAEWRLSSNISMVRLYVEKLYDVCESWK